LGLLANKNSFYNDTVNPTEETNCICSSGITAASTR